MIIHCVSNKSIFRILAISFVVKNFACTAAFVTATTTKLTKQQQQQQQQHQQQPHIANENKNIRPFSSFRLENRNSHLFASVAPPGETDTTSASITSSSWEDLENEITLLQQNEEDSDENQNKPVLTLYRDTNGWCPFCERVWICIRAKNLPYQERTISLFNKPEWYKEMVPTTQVPAVLFHNDKSTTESTDNNNNNNDDDNKINSRTLVWESLDIMKALDDHFPQTTKLVLDTNEYQQAYEMMESLTKAGFAYTYASREEKTSGIKLTPSEMEQRKQTFLNALDELEDALVQSSGSFRLGSDFTGIDAIMIPTLERWRYQLPISKQLDILDGRPALQEWFDAMHQFTPYGERVEGDQYSWVATTAMFARYFGNGEDDPDTQAVIDRSDSLATQLVSSFSSAITTDDDCSEQFVLEAVSKVVSNHEAIIQDCTNEQPLSQQHIPRGQSKDTANKMLMGLTKVLLNDRSKGVELMKDIQTMDFGFQNDDEKMDAARAASTIASRLCVPRDMSAPASKILRAALMTVAETLESK